MSRKRRYVPNLVADMAECDANYIRLHRLFPQMSEEDSLEFGIDSPTGADSEAGEISNSRDQISGITADGATVTIRITERCRYTTMMSVEVTCDDSKPWIRWPALEVRVYHDIKSAEVVSFERQRNFKFRYQLRNHKMYQPDEKSQINRYFGELLTFCYENGHSLEPVNVRG